MRRARLLAFAVAFAASCGWAPIALAQDDKPAVPAAPAAPADDKASKSPEKTLKETEPPPLVSGSLTGSYRYRATGAQHDQDITQTLALSLGDANLNPVTGQFLARLSEDLDGRRDPRGYYPFDSLVAGSDTRVELRLFHAFMDIQRVGPLGVLRVGRQELDDTPSPLFFDGLRAETKELDDYGALQFGVASGRPVHFFEISGGADVLAAAYIQIRPWLGARLKLQGIAARDDQRHGAEETTYAALSYWQRFDYGLAFQGRYTRLEDRDYELLLRGTYLPPEDDLFLQVSAYQLLSRTRSVAIEFDTYSSALQDYAPYTQLVTRASKGWTHLVVDVGYDRRMLRNRSDEGIFNHEFWRSYLTLTLRELGVAGLTLSVTGELFETSRRSAQQSLGGDITYRPRKGLALTLGSDTTLYQYDFNADRERELVRSVFVKAKVTVIESLTFDTRASYERDDFQDYVTVRVAATLRF